MRTSVAILADFDDPDSATPPLNDVDSTTNSIRDRLSVEVLLDTRDLLVDVKAILIQIRDA